MGDIVSARPASGAPIATAWGAEIHDAIEGIQTGKTGSLAGLGTNTGVSVNITFPRPYVTPPLVFVNGESNGYNAGSAAGITTTGCSIRAFNPSSNPQSSLIISWVAIGQIA